MTAEAPLAALLSRALGAEVTDVRPEPLGVRDGVETERVRCRVAGEERTLVFERFAPRAALEVQLLPFLARKSAHVPVVHARGIPPRTVAAPEWLLLEDLEDAATACDGEPRDVIDALVAVEEAVAADGPALRALGLTVRMPADIAEEIAAATAAEPDADVIAGEARESARRLQRWPTALVHGDLRCANAVRAKRGVVLRRWGRAYLGCALLDVVRLVADIVGRDDAVRGIGLSRAYAERTGVVLPTEVLRGAERLDSLMRRYLAAW